MFPWSWNKASALGDILFFRRGGIDFYTQNKVGILLLRLRERTDMDSPLSADHYCAWKSEGTLESQATVTMPTHR
jgi:hypothetical protein